MRALKAKGTLSSEGVADPAEGSPGPSLPWLGSACQGLGAQLMVLLQLCEAHRKARGALPHGRSASAEGLPSGWQMGNVETRSLRGTGLCSCQREDLSTRSGPPYLGLGGVKDRRVHCYRPSARRAPRSCAGAPRGSSREATARASTAAAAGARASWTSTRVILLQPSKAEAGQESALLRCTGEDAGQQKPRGP